MSSQLFSLPFLETTQQRANSLQQQEELIKHQLVSFEKKINDFKLFLNNIKQYKYSIHNNNDLKSSITYMSASYMESLFNEFLLFFDYLDAMDEALLAHISFYSVDTEMPYPSPYKEYFTKIHEKLLKYQTRVKKLYDKCIKTEQAHNLPDNDERFINYKIFPFSTAELYENYVLIIVKKDTSITRQDTRNTHKFVEFNDFIYMIDHIIQFYEEEVVNEIDTCLKFLYKLSQQIQYTIDTLYKHVTKAMIFETEQFTAHIKQLTTSTLFFSNAIEDELRRSQALFGEILHAYTKQARLPQVEHHLKTSVQECLNALHVHEHLDSNEFSASKCKDDFVIGYLSKRVKTYFFKMFKVDHHIVIDETITHLFVPLLPLETINATCSALNSSNMTTYWNKLTQLERELNNNYNERNFYTLLEILDCLDKILNHMLQTSKSIKSLLYKAIQVTSKSTAVNNNYTSRIKNNYTHFLHELQSPLFSFLSFTNQTSLLQDITNSLKQIHNVQATIKAYALSTTK